MGLHSRDYSEKRDFIRMKVDTPAEVTLTEQDIRCEGVCHDLSGGGMLLTLDRELEIDTELLVSVTTSYGHQPMINARCSVARVQLGPQNTYLHGLEITEVLNTPETEVESQEEVM